MINQRYKNQVSLLLKVLPEVARENNFALHGGTAINLFIRNMPRVSVDIDLTYIPIEARSESIIKINIALEKIKFNIEKRIKDVKVWHKKDIAKLIISTKTAEIKLEVNLVRRGLLSEAKKQFLTEKLAEDYNAFVAIQIVPFGQLYGSKVCAALDRQHPRDLFDIKYLLENEGLSRDVCIGFLLALVSNDRPMYEVLKPNFLDQRKAMANQFSGMTVEYFDYNDFEQIRLQLIGLLEKSLSFEDKKFLLSIKNLSPNWDIYNFEKFPAVRWKLQNLEKLRNNNPAKYRMQLDLLRDYLEV